MPAKLRKYASNTNKQHRNKFNSTSRIDNKIVKIVKKKTATKWKHYKYTRHKIPR